MAKPQYQWPPGLHAYILNRDNHKCQIKLPKCTTRATAVDHIIPTSEGGPWFAPTNLRAACRYCNSARANPKSRHNQDPKPSRHW